MLEHTAGGGAVRELQNLTTWEFACNPTHNDDKGPSGCGALPRARPVGQGRLLGAQHLGGCGATTSGLLHLTRALTGAPLSASRVLVTSQRKAPGLQKELISRRLTDRREKRLAAYPLLYLAGEAA